MSVVGELDSWKEEPVSPDWFELDDWVDYGDVTILEDIDFIIKEEPDYPGWAAESVDVGGAVFDSASDFSPVSPPQEHQQHQTGDRSPSRLAAAGWAEETKTSELLQEFEDVLTRALTPPDSPVHQQHQLHVSPPAQQPQPYYQATLIHLQPSPVHQASPIQEEAVSQESGTSITEIDAIVAESFNNNRDYASSSDSGYEDPDWAPASTAPGGKSRPRPYPSVEDRRARKKEQNKNAATRYRQKKKQEIEVILSEEKDLQDKNETLKAEVDEIQREMKYLKSLLRHMFKAKGMIR